MSCTSEVPRPSSAAICRLDRFRPMKERHNTQIRSGWWCPASTVPLRSSKRDAHAWQRYRCRCGCVSSCPFRTTASLPHPGQRTPSGQRCWRTKAKHFASSSKDARLPGSAVAMMTGTPRVRRPPPTAWNRHHTRTATTSLHHPGSRQEPLANVPTLFVLNRVPTQGSEIAGTVEAIRRRSMQVADVRWGERKAFRYPFMRGLTAQEVEPGSKAAKEVALLFDALPIPSIVKERSGKGAHVHRRAGATSRMPSGEQV